MLVMLCRNRVADFARWKSIFDSHAAAHQAAGLRLTHFWRSVDDPDNVFSLFEVDNLEKARAFVGAPAADRTGQNAGVLDGEFHFLETAAGY